MSETIVCPVAVRAARSPDAPAILTDQGILTYAGLSSQAHGFARWMDAEGVGTGDVLAVLGETSPEYVALLVATLRRGVVFSPISTRLPATAAQEGARDVGAVRTVDPCEVAFAEASSERLSEEHDLWNLDAPATAVFTSGSTGRPRAAVHSVRNHVASADGSRENIPLGPGDRWLLSLPLYHVGGLAIVFRCLLSGSTIVISEMQPEQSIDAHLITHASFVPTQLQRILESGRGRLTSLRAVLLGGSQIPASLIDQALEAGLPVHNSYGLTEMASQVATTPADASRADLQTAGFVLRGREVHIGSENRIHVRGDTRFIGFMYRSTLEEPFDEDGWYATGDIGSFDEQGRLVIQGRADQAFISGGENIHPVQIERALLDLPGIDEAVVVPTEDVEFGQRPVAFINVGTSYDLPTIRARLSAALPGFMLPVALYHLPPLEGLKRDRAHLAEVARRDRHVAR